MTHPMIDPSVTVRLFGADREFSCQESLDRYECAELERLGVHLVLTRHWDSRKQLSWTLRLGEATARGDTPQEAATECEQVMLPLTRLLLGQWREHIERLRRLAEAAVTVAHTLDNETIPSVINAALFAFGEQVNDYESWRWNLPAPPLLPELEAPTVTQLTREDTP